MDTIYLYLRACRTVSHLASDVAMAWSTLLALETLVNARRLPYLWVTVLLAFPFIVSLAIKVAGNMFGIIIEVLEASELQICEVDPHTESMREISQEVRARRSQPGAPSYTSAGTVSSQ